MRRGQNGNRTPPQPSASWSVSTGRVPERRAKRRRGKHRQKPQQKKNLPACSLPTRNGQRRSLKSISENRTKHPSYACYECFYPLGSYHLLRRKSDFAKLTQKKNAATSKKITTLSKSCSVLSRTFLFALFFDFGNLLCRCGYNPYACIAHTVKKRVKLPPLRVLLRRRF